MSSPEPRNTKAGGALLAGSILLGILVGVLVGQPSIGFLAGLGVGMLLVGAVWLIDRR